MNTRALSRPPLLAALPALLLALAIAPPARAGAPANLALGRAVTPLTNTTDGDPANATDGDHSTSWYSGQGPGTNEIAFALDLGGLHEIQRYVFKPLQTATWTIDSSEDGVTWTNRHSDATDDWEDPSVVSLWVDSPYSARYLRYRGENTGGLDAGIAEFEVYPDYGARILALQQRCGGSPETVFDTLDRMEAAYAYEGHTESASFTDALENRGPWDLVIVDSYSDSLPSTLVAAVVNHIAGGGRAIVCHWDWANTALLADAMEAGFVGDYFSPQSQYRWETTHPIFTTPYAVGDFTNGFNDLCNRDGARFTATGSAIPLAGFAAAPEDGQHAIILGNGGRTLLNGQVFDVMPEEVMDLLENQIRFLLPLGLLVEDSVSPTLDRWVPFGEVVVGESRTEQVTLRNTSATNLVVSGIGFAEEAEQQPEAPATTVPCFGINMLANTLVSFDANDPGTLTTIGPTGSDLISAVEFVDGDFSRLLGIVYGANQLIWISTADATRTTIGPCMPLGGQLWTGLAEDPTDGTVYAAASDGGNSHLYRINVDTGAATHVGSLSSPYLIIAIAINSQGQLYGVDILNDVLVSIDKNSGASTTIGPLGVNANYAQGMDFDGETDILYWASYSFGPELRTIDTSTGASTLVGGFPSGSELNIAVAKGKPSGPFQLEGLPDFPATILPGESLTFNVIFAPKTPGAHEAELLIESDDANDPKATVQLTGTGIEGTPIPVSQDSVMELPPENFLAGEEGRFDCAESSDTNVVFVTVTPEGLLRIEARNPGRAVITLCVYNERTGETEPVTLLLEVVGEPSVQSNGFRERDLWNPRFEQLIRILNDAGYDAIGVRVLFSDLQPGIEVENQTGISDDGRPMIELESPFPDGGTLDLSIVYLCTGAFRVDQFPPTLEFQYILPAWVPPSDGEGIPVSVRLLMTDGSGRVVLEFESVPGRSYAIEYMDDFPDGAWTEVPLVLRAGANRTQWIDSGPPATQPPSGMRVYRVKDVTVEGGSN